MLLAIIAIACATTANAEYKETMVPSGPTTNVGTDYGLVDDNAKTNQSDVPQKAIDDVAASGGGRLVIPKGTYRFAKILLKSNVHLLIEKDTVIKPYWPEGEKTVVFNLDAERGDARRNISPNQTRSSGKGHKLHTRSADTV